MHRRTFAELSESELRAVSNFGNQLFLYANSRVVSSGGVGSFESKFESKFDDEYETKYDEEYQRGRGYYNDDVEGVKEEDEHETEEEEEEEEKEWWNEGWRETGDLPVESPLDYLRRHSEALEAIRASKASRE